MIGWSTPPKGAGRAASHTHSILCSIASFLSCRSHASATRPPRRTLFLLTPRMSTPEAPEAASAPAPEIPDSDAEVYAASAAENALPSDKQTPSAPDDLSALSEALDAAVLEEKNADAHKVIAGGDAPPADPAEDTPTLSKEEMVEEALACPCIAAMRDGPCGDAFTSAYRCFLESETEPKGMNCIDSFSAMQTCMVAHPEDYPVDEDGDPNLAEGKMEQPDVAETKSAEGADVQQTQPQTAEVSSSR
ncbi:unnamed protein product [Chondrus crispus]|uniref:GCK domain-containing protein n=1 Tax=Chondrus crispus TaxID=2769 RepID=S0F2S5_CHOCR|nr:unnamed protein product [Chondrus crispus]CDF77416.1 unnamed protein product [Chondrus crispus]|eukprot:XP_005712290.1 unnamed protein product [Chondrus crispus]